MLSASIVILALSWYSESNGKNDKPTNDWYQLFWIKLINRVWYRKEKGLKFSFVKIHKSVKILSIKFLDIRDLPKTNIVNQVNLSIYKVAKK